MANQFSQTGTQVQTQTQQLSLQQLLVSQLTEMPVEALYERVDQELKENIALERDSSEEESPLSSADGDATASAESGDDDGIQSYGDAGDFGDALLAEDYGGGASSREERGGVVGEMMSFYDQLEEQIGFFHLTEHEEEIIRYLIGSLDDDGLLRTSLQQIQDELEVYHNIPTSQDELEHILSTLQRFEPAGIGARSLQECLLLQVRRSPDHASPLKQKLERVLTEQFDNLMQNHWDRIQRSMKLTDSDVARLQREVRRLNPRPGSSMGEALGKSLQQITPDFIVDTDPYGHLTLSLNNGRIPPLRVSEDDLGFLHSYEGRDPKTLSRSERDGVLYLRERVEKARSFIDALQQRRRTLTQTMKTIMQLQHSFFESGDETLLRPMTLEDVAQRTGLHLSTVSRVSNSKWVQTPYGIYPLRWFFTSAARMQDGDEVSVRSIKATLQEIIDAEDKRHPLSDDALATQLQRHGFDVARRTVTKYRIALGIPVARLRR